MNCKVLVHWVSLYYQFSITHSLHFCDVRYFDKPKHSACEHVTFLVGEGEVIKRETHKEIKIDNLGRHIGRIHKGEIYHERISQRRSYLHPSKKKERFHLIHCIRSFNSFFHYFVHVLAKNAKIKIFNAFAVINRNSIREAVMTR